MPIIKSAKKALRQNIRRRKRNLAAKNKLKSLIKRYRKLVQAGSKEEAKKYLSQTYKKLDKATKSNVVKKNKASRLKSRLSKLINKK